MFLFLKLIHIKQSVCLQIKGLQGWPDTIWSLSRSPAAGADMGDAADAVMPTAGQGIAKICLITGFESFNSGLYQQVFPAMLLMCSPKCCEPPHTSPSGVTHRAWFCAGSS